MADPIFKHKLVKEEIARIKADHSTKTKALMKSINKLKEDIEKDKYQNQDNVRAKIIERMKKDIGENEVVIEMMRDMINDDESINKEMVKILSKGPARARVLSREELREEIKRLKGEVGTLKANGGRKPKPRSSHNTSEVDAVEQSFDNMTLEKFKEMKNDYEKLQVDFEAKDDELQKAQEAIADLKDDKKTAGISLHSLLDKVRTLDEDKKAFERVKLKLKEFRSNGLFKGIELDSDEEEDDETTNLLNKLNKLLDSTRGEIDKQDKHNQDLRDTMAATQKEMDDIDDVAGEFKEKYISKCSRAKLQIFYLSSEHWI